MLGWHHTCTLIQHIIGVIVRILKAPICHHWLYIYSHWLNSRLWINRLTPRLSGRTPQVLLNCTSSHWGGFSNNGSSFHLSESVTLWHKQWMRASPSFPPTRLSMSVLDRMYVLTLAFWWRRVYSSRVAWSERCCSHRAVYRLLKLIWKVWGCSAGGDDVSTQTMVNIENCISISLIYLVLCARTTVTKMYSWTKIFTKL